MSTDKPFRVEVVVDAPRDEVWRALTEPERIRHWFGWQYDGLEDEIKFIFVDHATHVAPERIDMPADGRIDLIEQGAKTLVRATKPGDLDAVEWKDVFGDIEEGWITFFNQLRHRIARHPDATRRTIFRTGKAALPALPGDPWHESRFQRGADVDGELLVVFVKPEGDAAMLVTTYDLDDDAFAAAEARWDAWWATLSSGPSRGPGAEDAQVKR